MKLARVNLADGVAACVEVADRWVRVAALSPRFALISDALADFDSVRAAVDAADVDRLVRSGDAVPRAGASLDVPLDRTGKILAIGRNYQAHIDETKETRPDHPLLFGKFPSSMVAPYCDIVVDPRLTAEADYEVELAMVIGAGGRDLSRGDALRVVGGYTVANDLSSRDNQYSESQWIRSKSFDGFCPIGPWITSADEVPEPESLRLTTDVNGERRQDSNTALMLFGLAELIEYLSQGISLEPGDVILTGTPSGVAAGMDDPKWLRPGDVVRCEVEGLGHIENRIVGPS